VKLVAEFESGETTEIEVAHLERDVQVGLADLGLRLAEAGGAGSPGKSSRCGKLSAGYVARETDQACDSGHPQHR